MKCPAIHANRDVIVSGNTEEGNYGEVIHFECESSEKKIDGSRDIHCTETGDWSAPVPKCIGSFTFVFFDFIFFLDHSFVNNSIQ